MDEYVRCIFCLSGDEERVKSGIEKAGLGSVIIPMKEKSFRRNGVWEAKTERMMPGYLFVYSSEETDFGRVKAADGVVRVLTYGADKQDSYLKGRDKAFAQLLKKKKGTVAKLAAVKEGDFVRVTDGALQEMHGRVIGINKGRHMVNVELEFFGRTTEVWLGYEIIEVKENAE